MADYIPTSPLNTMAVFVMHLNWIQNLLFQSLWVETNQIHLISFAGLVTLSVLKVSVNLKSKLECTKP